MNQSKVAAVKSAVKGRWLEVLEAIAPSLKDACNDVGHHVPCPIGSGTKDGFRLFDDAKDTGAGYSNQHGAFYNGFDLLMWVLDKDFPYVLNEVAEYLGLGNKKWMGAKVTETFTQSRPKVDESQLKKCRYALRKAWQTAFDLTAPEAKLARKYLDSRGLNLKKLDLYSLSKTMRFNPSMPLYENRKVDGKKRNIFVGNFPAIISLVSYPDGKAATIHRTFLDHNGNKLNVKVEGEDVNPKKLMSRCESRSLSGSSIQLGIPESEIMHISEGIETGLSVRQVLAERNITNEPVWPCVSTTIMENFEPPKGVKYLFIWADKDIKRLVRGKMIEPGLDAAMKVAERMEDRDDVMVFIMYPQHDIPEGSKSVDWNDVLNQDGSEGFPLYHRQIYREVA